MKLKSFFFFFYLIIEAAVCQVARSGKRNKKSGQQKKHPPQQQMEKPFNLYRPMHLFIIYLHYNIRELMCVFYTYGVC